MTANDRLRAIQIVVEFDKGLFQHFDVPGWNAFIDDLRQRMALTCRSVGWRTPTSRGLRSKTLALAVAGTSAIGTPG